MSDQQLWFNKPDTCTLTLYCSPRTYPFEAVAVKLRRSVEGWGDRCSCTYYDVDTGVYTYSLAERSTFYPRPWPVCTLTPSKGTSSAPNHRMGGKSCSVDLSWFTTAGRQPLRTPSYFRSSTVLATPCPTEGQKGVQGRKGAWMVALSIPSLSPPFLCLSSWLERLKKGNFTTSPRVGPEFRCHRATACLARPGLSAEPLSIPLMGSRGQCEEGVVMQYWCLLHYRCLPGGTSRSSRP